MDHRIAAFHGGLHSNSIKHVALDSAHVRMLIQPGGAKGIAPEGVEHNDLVVRGKPLHQVRADEAGAACQKNASS